MRWPTVPGGLFRLKALTAEVAARLFPGNETQIVGQIFEDVTISVEPLSRFKLCQFSHCSFVWEDAAVETRPKLFLSCNFDDCDYGMPAEAFFACTFGSTVNQRQVARLTPEQALEEAVRRIHQRQPDLTEQCLDPASWAERECLAQWVSAEYRKILMDA